MRLRNQQVRRQGANQLAVNAVQWLARANSAIHFAIDFTARNRNIEGRLAATGKRFHPGGIVTLMRSPYQPVARAQRAHDLGSTSQQRNDALPEGHVYTRHVYAGILFTPSESWASADDGTRRIRRIRRPCR